jgi:hypothetical protein
MAFHRADIASQAPSTLARARYIGNEVMKCVLVEPQRVRERLGLCARSAGGNRIESRFVGADGRPGAQAVDR